MSSPFVQELHGASVRLDPLWQAVRTRLNSGDVLGVLLGGKNWIVWEDYSAPEGDLSKAWGRQIVKPVETMWPAAEVETSYRGVNFLVVSEMWWYRTGYNPATALERLQQLDFMLLQGWAPTGLNGVLVRQALYRYRGPQQTPMWDEDRRIWWLSSEYRCEVTRIPEA